MRLYNRSWNLYSQSKTHEYPNGKEQNDETGTCGNVCSRSGEGKEIFEKYLGGTANDLYHNRTTDFQSYFISFDDGARLEIMTRPGIANDEKDLTRSGWIHVAFSVGSRERVDSLTARLKADGYKVVSGPRTTGDGYYESCVVAIEGNQIEITV